MKWGLIAISPSFPWKNKKIPVHLHLSRNARDIKQLKADFCVPTVWSLFCPFTKGQTILFVPHGNKTRSFIDIRWFIEARVCVCVWCKHPTYNTFLWFLCFFTFSILGSWWDGCPKPLLTLERTWQPRCNQNCPQAYTRSVGAERELERLPQLSNEHGGLFIQMRVAGELKVKEAAFTTARHRRKPDLGWAEDHMQGMW